MPNRSLYLFNKSAEFRLAKKRDEVGPGESSLVVLVMVMAVAVGALGPLL